MDWINYYYAVYLAVCLVWFIVNDMRKVQVSGGLLFGFVMLNLPILCHLYLHW